MPKRNSRLYTALISAPFAFAAGCSPTLDVGAMSTCGDDGVVCDLEGEVSDGSLPIGEPNFENFDRAAFQSTLAGMAGDWHGVAAGLETIWPPFEMHFSEATDEGSGQFSVHCLEKGFCLPLGAFEAGNSSGDYRLIYVDDEQSGQGEFSWDAINGMRTSFRFRNLLLQKSDQVLFFVIDSRVLGNLQVVMQRGLSPDGGSENSATASDAGTP